MDITIGKPCAISEKGGRSNNEDSIFPLPEHTNASQKLFIVCDGVGGAEKGEVASSLACESLHTYFSTFLEGEPTESFIRKAIQYTEACFDSYLQEHPEAKGMATTLALLYVGTSGVMAAHIGDSRIYLFRQGEIRFCTEDHSLVNSLIKLGTLTPEEARSHPRRNVITRAIQGSHCSAEADITRLDDLSQGDTFLICSDGVLERLDNEALSHLLAQQPTAGELKDQILHACDGKTRDNFSFHVIPIQKTQDSSGIKQNILSFLYSFI